MANTKKTTQKETVESTEKVNLDFTKKKKTVKIEDGTLIRVKSTYPGTLKYCNLKNGDSTKWEGAGDVQDITMSDLRAMKATQIAFFKNRWILILGLTEDDEDISCEDIYYTLGITKFYENYLEPTDVNTICSWSPAVIPERVAMLSNGAQENLIIALNECIKSGTLDSLAKIKAFEKALDCKLRNPFDDAE